jgi:7-keto-8-aminopelargonate synthetase-like enzyme
MYTMEILCEISNRVIEMPETVKLNQWEQEALEARLNYLNKKLIMNGFKTLKSESQIVHKIIEMTINKVEIDENGNIRITD